MAHVIDSSSRAIRADANSLLRGLDSLLRLKEFSVLRETENRDVNPHGASAYSSRFLIWKKRDNRKFPVNSLLNMVRCSDGQDRSSIAKSRW
jgi:hypothetical protein